MATQNRRGRTWARRAGLAAALVGLIGATAYAVNPFDSPSTPIALPNGGLGAADPRTEHGASRIARESGKQVEVTGMRAENRQTYANPDGSFTQLIHQQPVQVVKDGKWVPTDPNLERNADGSVTPKASVADLKLSGGGADTPFVTMEKAGRRYSLTWPGTLPPPLIEGTKATYQNVLPDVDLVVHTSVTGFTHVLVLKTPAAAKLAQVRAVQFGLDLELLKVARSATGGLRMVDAGSGGTVFETPKPRMWDSTGLAPGADGSAKAADGVKKAGLGVTVDATSLTLRPDTGMLDAADTKYPVYVDPFTTSPARESWAMVDSGYPSEEYWKFDGEADERVGKCPVGIPIYDCHNSLVKRLFYVLPTSFPADAVVSSAKFRITQSHRWDDTAHNVSLYRAGSSGALITSATNWGNMPGGASMSKFVKQQTIAPTGEAACGTSATRNVEFNVSEAIGNAVKNRWSKTTFMIRSDNESDHEHLKRFCNNAVVAVTYNRPPKQPAISGLAMNPGGACVNTDARPYVSSLPVLKAVLSDPDTMDGEPLIAEFQVRWTPPGGTVQSPTPWKSSALANGLTFSYNLADTTSGVPNLPQNVIVQWRVRAFDGVAYSPWSSEGSGHYCEFILDKTKPIGPDIDSPQYIPGDATDTTPNCLDDDPTWFPGVGRYGTFTFDSSATDVNAYWYGFDTNPSSVNKLTPSTDGGPVTTKWQPLTDGPHTINVLAVDRAGKTSDTASCTFRVAAGSDPVAEWRLDDAAGSGQAADTTGTSPATVLASAQLGVDGPGGPADKAVRLTGTSSSALATGNRKVVDTGNSFTVSAWAKLDDTTRWQTVVSQDGTGEPGFNLGYVPNTGKWAITSPVTDVWSLGSWGAYGTVAEKGRWTHLTATFDRDAQRVTLYVNGVSVASSAWRSSWTSHGAVQIGRRYISTGVYGDSFVGDVADVRLYDRTLVPSEIQGLPTQLTSRFGYWDLDSATPVEEQAPLIGKSAGYGASAAELEPALELGLYTGASVFTRDPEDPFPLVTPLVGDGHLILDGATGYAATASPVAVTHSSFSVVARVRLATACTRETAVLSQPGAHASGFTLGCVPDGSGDAKWQVTLPASDANGATGVTVTADTLRPDPTATTGQILAVTYDAAQQKLRLYVDGQLTGTAADVPPTWNATGGGLQIGRSLDDSAWGRYLPGVVDEVRVYSGALDQTTVQQLNTFTEVADL
ncbi:hypothetical protein GCM10010112_25960 [Actinoplanes lobatus]|uniref:LamG-like jellyroll fold domain-containing protein n=1 Tax=Actinoplanes lobatus TaxID=113568 RepID=A0A7W7MIK0_9ACTN|nr:LamG domain-containing protein [Actinoplanes lobatus]MBB4751637.1 hypothetical protein [Actinoplanes lobatus]GGN65063.1 hypothetical protein GCM10010112_25960 [Actinoplanes lobatus]GIE43221.1 hypothetical protein Alo02nite_61190 [Actinoplanes lobatus]